MATATCFHNYALGYCYICNGPSQTRKDSIKPAPKHDNIIILYDSDDDTVFGSVDSYSSKKEAREARRAYRKTLEDELIAEKEKLKAARRELEAYRRDVRTFEREVDSRERKVRSIERKIRVV